MLMMKLSAPLTRALLSVVAILLVAIVTLRIKQHYSGATSPSFAAAALYAQHRLLPPFVLHDGDGHVFDRNSLKGRYTFVFFGYTQCPDVCSTTFTELTHVARALADLPKNLQPAVVFISVDPDRDSPAMLKNYANQFNAAFIGITGGNYALTTLTQALGAHYAHELPVDGSYSVTHSASLFLIDPSAALLASFPAPHAAKSIAADYRKLVATP